MKIIKLGGSVITKKDSYRSANHDLIKKISKILGNYPEPLFLIHGAGSFGHIRAMEYNLSIPGKVRGKEFEITVVINDVLALNSIVSDSLASDGFRGISIPTHSIYSNNGPNFELLDEIIKNSFSPIMYGDIIIQNGNYRIISGDEIALDLAKRYKPEEIIFLTDVDGLYSSDPKEYSNAKFFRDIKISEIDIRDRGKDATGSMTGKIEKIKLMLPYTKRVVIINGLYPDRLKKVLNDEDTIGTVIH